MATFGSGFVKISMRDLLDVVFRHKKKMVFCFLMMVGAVTLYTYVIPEKYRSEAKVYLRVGRESLALDPSVSGPTVAVMESREAEVNSELSILTSRSLAEKVVETLGADVVLCKPDEAKISDGPQEDLRIIRRFSRAAAEPLKQVLVTIGFLPSLSPREKAVKSIIKNISVEVEKRSSIISVRYDAQAPRIAQETLNRLLDYYLEHHIRMYSAQASPEFFEKQIEGLREELTRREQALSDFRTQNGIAALDGQKRALIDQARSLEEQAADAAVQVNSARARVSFLEESLKNRPSTVELKRTSGRPNHAADEIKTRLMDLRIKEAELSSRYSDTHRPLMQVRQQIRDTEAALGKEQTPTTEVTTGIDGNYQDLQMRLAQEAALLRAQEARQGVVNEELARAREQLASLSGKEMRLYEMQRDVDLVEKDYQRYRESFQRSETSAALDRDKVSNVRIVQPATLPLGTVSPRKLLNIGIGILLGLFSALLLALVAEYLDDTLSTKEKAEKWLGVPVLGVISEGEFKSCT